MTGQLLDADLARRDGLGVPVDRAKHDLVACVSHELRTPLTSILGYTDLLLDGAADQLTPLQHRMVERVERNGQRMLKLVENLLVLSDFQAGAFCLVRQHVDLADLVGDAMARSAPALTAAGLDLTYDIGRPSYVIGDETQLSQALTCLIDNAVTFTPRGGDLRVTLQADGRHAVLTVLDTGIGIPTEEQERVFLRFARAPEALMREDQGVGLGLAVVRSIVLSHGGDVTLSSTPGVGTVVTVRLPAVHGESSSSSR